MNPQTSNPTLKKATPVLPRIRTVALCNVDPDKFTTPPPGMPAAAGTNVVISLDCSDAIHAAMNGDVDVLVVDGKELTVDGLTALSFLQVERPDLPVYFFLEEQGSTRLQPWDLAA